MARLALLTAALVALVMAAPAAATYPGRNGPIAYVQNAGGGDDDPTLSSSIMLQRSRAAEPRTLVECVQRDGVRVEGDCTAMDFSSLSFSPDGRTIAFDAGAQIGLIAVGGGPVTLLPAATDNDGDPVFTPDGKRIVFAGANDHGSTDLYVRRADGSGPARLLIGDASQPAVSVRGVLAYVRSGNVYLRLPKGVRRFVTSGVLPDWSPDGKRLAIIRPRPNLTFDAPYGRIYTVRPTGRGLTRVGRSNYASSPAWSPDGRRIAYDGFDLGVHVKLVGSHRQAREWAPTQISGESGTIASFDPAWRPLR